MTTRRSAETGDPRVRLNAPPDILATIPFLVGYHPTDSIVVLGMREHRLTFTARDDLPPAGSEPSLDQIAYLVEVLLRQSCDGVLLVGLGPEDRAAPMVAGLCVAYEQVGVTVREALRAHDGRYYSYLCRNPSCCPPEGVPYDSASSAVAAAWTVTGRVARRDRAEYEAQIRPATGAVRDAMRRATEAAHDRLVALITEPDDEELAEAALLNAGNLAVAEALDRQLRGERLDDDQVAWLSVLLGSIQVRDIAWSLIRGSGPMLFHHRALWLEVLRRAEADLVPAPASLFAFAAWRCGEGGIARLALERAMDEDPNYRMATLLHDAITHGLPPSALDGFPEPPVRRRRAVRRRRRSSTRRVGSRRG